MRVLVFDSNVDFALRAVEFIKTHVKHAYADMASNVFVLRHRLKEGGPWDFVVADVAAAGFMDDVLAELKSADCPVILWSTLEDSVYTTQETMNKFKLVKKPKTPDQLSTTISNLVETA